MGSLWAVLNLVEPMLASPKALHDFFFNRSPIQWLTLGVFFFAIAVLTDRFIYCLLVLRSLRNLSENRPLRGTRAATGVAQRFKRVQACMEANGPRAAVSYSVELASLDEEELNRIYGLLSHATQLMLALGFLGTVWGISRSMSGSFGNLSVGMSTELLKSILGDFSQGLSTALDTTVLGLICSLVTTVLMTTVKWCETSALLTLKELVHSCLSLETAIHHRDADPLQALQAEISTMAASLIRTTEATMQELVVRSVQVFEAKLTDAVQQQLGRVEAHERQICKALTEALSQQMAINLKALQKQGDQTSTALITELRCIAEQLQRAPEVSIHYPTLNGRGHEAPQRE
jgi:hypothetical protein